MSEYTVTRMPREAGAVAPYRFAILLGEEKVAEVQHSHRGEDFEIRTSGSWRPCDRILTGGGPVPLVLTAAGTRLLDELLAR